MTGLDADAIRLFAGEFTVERFAGLHVFAEIDSTNSFLMQQPGPHPGELSLAVTTNQTAGRGRHGKTWHSPPGSGLCLSAAYTFASEPQNLPALTLALGLGVVDALEELGIDGVQLKWPNDLVALDGKLGGILTERQQRTTGSVTVVTGIGLNLDLTDVDDFGAEADWARRVVDLKSLCEQVPQRERIAGVLATRLLQAFVEYESNSFARFIEPWSRRDWLFGRKITVDTANGPIAGVGAGVAADGALLVSTPGSGVRRVTSGSIVVAGDRAAQP